MTNTESASRLVYAGQVRPGDRIYQHADGATFHLVTEASTIASSGVRYLTLESGRVLSIDAHAYVSVV